MAAPTLDELQEQIVQLDAKLEKLSGNMDSLDKSVGGLNQGLGDSNNLLGDAVKSTVEIQKNFRKFALDTQAQYKYAEKLAESSKKTSVNIGLSVGRSQEFTKQFNRATAQMQKFGMEAADVNSIMTEFAENSGRARIMTPDEVLNIGLMERGLGLGAESAARMMERMDLMGMNAKVANTAINEMVASSQSLGLNANKVAKVLSNNFKGMSNMSFQNGVKGMTSMAKLAVQMRMDVGDMLGMAEKFYEPEGAIEAAANLQMLGGDIADAFGDPFEVMYLARNKPEELAEKVKLMTEDMIQFNDATGEYEFPAEARMQLKAAGEQLGINVDSMMDIARQSSKIKDIKMKVSSNIVDDDMREGLASLARLDESGNWVIDMAGQKEPLKLEDIGMEDAADIMAAPKDSDEAIMDMAYNSMTTNEILKNIEKALKTGFVAESNVYEISESVLAPSMSGLFSGVESQVGKMIDAIKDTPYGNFRESMIEQAEALGMASGDGLTKFFETNFLENIDGAMDAAGKTLAESFSTDLDKILSGLKPVTGESEKKVTGEGDFLLRNDGTKVSFSTEDDVVGAKRGGPLDKLMDKSLTNTSSGTPSKIEFGTLTINGKIDIVSPDGSSSNIDMSTMKPEIEKMIRNHMSGANVGGTPTGKQSMNNG